MPSVLALNPGLAAAALNGDEKSGQHHYETARKTNQHVEVISSEKGLLPHRLPCYDRL